MNEIRKAFSEIEDPRHSGYTKHKLVDILVMVMCAVLCGLTELVEIMQYIEEKFELLRENFEIDKIPSKPTVSRILNMVDGHQVGEVIIKIMANHASELDKLISVDGKAIRSTNRGGSPKSALQILTAYLTESGVTLAQETIHEKTNEIPVFQEMLDYLNIEGKTITADAMHCQKETCQKIINKNGDYIFGAKENQKNLYDDIKLYFNDKINADEIETTVSLEKNGGRIEKRICRSSHEVAWLAECGWAGLSGIFSITRITDSKNKHSEETNYYITSKLETAKVLLNNVRAHWGIESMHWMLDVVFGEDDCGLLSENGHAALNVFRKLALLAHKTFMSKQTKKISIKGNVLKCLINDQRLLQVLEVL